MGLDVFDIVAVILGVIFTIRKLDAQRRAPEEFPHVDRDRFLSWRTRETHVYTAGMMACFFKVFAKLGLTVVLAERIPYTQLRLLGAVVDISWFLIVVYTLVRAYRLAMERAQLKIVLGGFIVEDRAAARQELTTALSAMKAGDFDEAQQLLSLVVSDGNEAQKAIALYYIGQCYLMQGREEEAQDAFLESAETDPTLAQPKDALAKLRAAH